LEKLKKFLKIIKYLFTPVKNNGTAEEALHGFDMFIMPEEDWDNK